MNDKESHAYELTLEYFRLRVAKFYFEHGALLKAIYKQLTKKGGEK